jgi:hypothetical protein
VSLVNPKPWTLDPQPSTLSCCRIASNSHCTTQGATRLFALREVDQPARRYMLPGACLPLSFLPPASRLAPAGLPPALVRMWCACRLRARAATLLS